MKLLLLLLLLLLLMLNFGQACLSSGRQTARVDENPMSDWTEWSQCSVSSCGIGKQTRSRNRVLLPNEVETESRNCGTACVVTFEWSSWSSWSKCSATCGQQGVSSRLRECVSSSDWNPSQAGCPGEWLQTEACNEVQCPPAVQWTRWSNWADCSQTCVGGRQTRSRQCLTEQLEPAPSTANCSSEQGVSEETRDCNEDVQCPSVAEWQPWSEWSQCSLSCGPGRATRTRIRQCQPDELPNNCIKPADSTETQSSDCNIADCPRVNGGWNSWNPWSNCLATCGWHFRVRNRYCTNPPPSGGGADCVGSSVGYEDCLAGTCRVDGHWGEWKPCPASLGGPQCNTIPRGRCSQGYVLYCRDCDKPKPQFGGSPCITGLASDRRQCWNVDACDNSIVQSPMNFSVVGFLNSSDLLVVWRRAPFGLPASSFFLTWSVVGADLRKDAVIPAAAESQQELLGEAYKYWIRGFKRGVELDIAIATRSVAGGVPRASSSLSERFRISRVDGGWGGWSYYSGCSPTEDCNIPGTRTRTRLCDNPLPTNGGLPCVGSNIEQSRCFHMC